MNPAAVLSILVKADGAATAAGQLKAVDSAGKKAGATLAKAGVSASKASDLYQDAAGKWRTASGRFASDAEKAAAGLDTTSKAAKRTADSVDRSGKIIGVAFKAAAAVTIGGGVALVGAVKASANFEKQMSSLKAVTDASGKTMEQFKKQAIDAGIKTSFSAREAAVAQTELAKGGLSVKNIMGGGLASALSLAAAGNMDLGEAAATTANAMNLFGLKGKQSQRVADALATAANATTADVSDFAMALTQGGAAAKASGLGFKDTVVELELLAKAGVKGSDAGTSLKSALTQIANPTDKAQGLMDKLGLKFFDANGKIKTTAERAAMLRDKLGGLTKEQRVQAATTLAGTDGMRALLAEYDAGGPVAEKFGKGLSKSGSAAKVAATMQDNLAGKFEQFKGTLETIAIVVGDKVRPTVQKVVEALTGFANGLLTGEGAGGKFRDAIVNAFDTVKGAVTGVVGQVREFVQQFQDGQGKAVALGAALAGLAAGAVAIQAVTTATRLWAAAQLAVNIVMAANPFVIAAGLLVALGAAFYVAYQKSETFRNGVNAVFNAVKGALNATVTWIKGAVKTVIDEVSEWKLLFTVVKTVWMAQFNALKSIVTAGVGAIITTFKVAMAVLGPIVSGAWAGIKQIISGALNVIKGVVKIFGGVLKGDFGQIWDGIKQTFSGAAEVIVGAVRALGGAMVGAFKAVPGKMLSIAGDIISGLANGIRSKAGEIISAIQESVTDAIPDFVKKALGIASPSKVMAALGGFIGQGLVDGLLSKKQAIAAGLKGALLFPVDAAISALNDRKDQLQKTWDAIDARAQRSALVAATTAKAVTKAVSASTGGSSGVGSGVLGGGKFLQGMGLQVGESKYFGGVTTDRHKHYPNDHYSGNSIDVNAAGGGAAELAKLQKALTALREKFRSSLVSAMIEDAGTANQHLHATFKTAGSAAKAAAATVKTATAKVNAKATGKLTANQMRGLLYAEGFRGHDLDTAVAIGMAESGGKVKATNRNTNGSIDRGFMQINSVHGALSTFNAEGNAAAAKKIFDQAGGSFSPWATYNSGAFQKFMGNTGSGKGSASSGKSGSAKSDIESAKKALADFDKAARRTNALAKIDLQIKNLEQLNNFKTAINGVTDKLRGLAEQAAAAWRQIREKEIDKAHSAALDMIAGSAEARELASLEAKDREIADAKEVARLDKDLADAKASGTQTAITDAEDAIAGYKRGKREEELRLWIANETAKADTATETAKAGLDVEEENYKASLVSRLTALTLNLGTSKESYAKFAGQVQGILDGLHLPPGIPGFATDAAEEAVINGGAGALGQGSTPGLVSVGGVVVTPQAWESGALLAALLAGSKKGYATGTMSAAAGLKWVGERGPELVNFDGGERVYPHATSMAMASGSGAGYAPVVEVNVAPGMEWLKQFISVQMVERERGSKGSYRAGVA